MSAKGRGFTLVEVMVALTIAASALILLLSANHESLRRSVRSRTNERIEELAESKLDEILCHAEQSTRGMLTGLPGFTWELERDTAGLETISGLDRITFRIHSDTGQVVKNVSVLQYSGKAKIR